MRQIILLVYRRHQFLRFLIVGTVNTLFSYGIYALLIFVGSHYTFANLAALILGILFSFKTQGHFVFRNSDNRLVGRFFLSFAMIYVATITLIGSFVTIGLNEYFAGAAALPFSSLMSYFVQKFFVFRERSKAEENVYPETME